MNKETFELMDIFEKAKEKFLKEEKEIIEININERTLSARLMFHLQTLLLSEIYQEKYKNYFVDCEYNKSEENTKKIPKDYRDLDKDKSIYPDVILHQRKKKKNLIIIEMKKTESSDEDGKNENRDRLEFLTRPKSENENQYTLGIYFEIGIISNNHIIEFFVKGKRYDYSIYKSLESKINDILNLIPFEEFAEKFEIK